MKLQGAALIEAKRLKERDAYFKIRKIAQMKFQTAVIFSFQIIIDNYHYDM